MNMAVHTFIVVASSISVVSFVLGWITNHSGIIRRIGKWLSFTGNVLQEIPNTAMAVKSGDAGKVADDVTSLINEVSDLVSNNTPKSESKEKNDAK